FSTYWGGANYDLGTAIAVDASGNAYVAGDAYSSNFPVFNGAQGTPGGNADVFVSKFSASGVVSWSTLLGGSGDEHAGGVAVDAAGSVYVAGGTSSSNFPLANSFQSSLHGSQDALVTKIRNDGAQFLYSTYLGGNGGGAAGLEQANGIAVD